MASEQDPVPAPAQQRQPQPQPQDPDTEMLDQQPPAPPAQTEPSATSTTEDPENTPQNQQDQSQTQPQNQDQDATQEEKQPTPPPAAPPPPPPPGPRAARLQALFASTAKHTLDKINKENFGACFPTISNKAPGTLEFVQRQMVERLGGLWNKEFETIMANRQVVARLNELEELVGDATRRRMEADDPSSPPVPPHTLPAPTILQAHLAPHLASHQSQLNAKLQNTQAANARLWDEIRAQRAEMEALLAGVEKAVRDTDGANGLLGEVADELAAETRAAEGDVRAVTAGGGGGGGGGAK
ncbi:Nnf1-domain-containing protein [Chaetomium fimeti]|uniref:Nnf1-domain-containing protein n=1 Tax=Chaetomium fimeti TaxID=1854472 RepID=A0AAE0HFW8_9PEZI|nr:Nnf1-domain-containing protein [Chaetomium fimeti]